MGGNYTRYEGALEEGNSPRLVKEHGVQDSATRQGGGGGKTRGGGKR